VQKTSRLRQPRPSGAADTLAPLLIVGIGASAGGLAAFEAFFSALPPTRDPAVAFVLVQHLAPDHKSLLSELVRRYTHMRVLDVEGGMTVAPNCAYVIPPNRDMALLGGTLQLLEPTLAHGQRLPIDFFFRSLAQDQGERAIGIILSGSGSDGTLGVRAIKEAGGMVMAQTPETTEYDSMPRSAIATGLVDYVLPPGDMGAQLLEFVAGGLRRRSRPILTPDSGSEDALKHIYVLLRAHTGHDFSGYKLNTISRRVARRMNIHRLQRLDEYVRYLQRRPEEIQSLFQEILIGVTHFFRDAKAFTALQDTVLAPLVAAKEAGASIRVWVPGCSTGEEAFSIAILLEECLQARTAHLNIQVFATDIDRRAIEQARIGRYSAGIAADVSAERLVRSFSREPDGSYHIAKSIRDMVVFSEQDVLRDAPFSRLDLISCRNLFIYLESEPQQKLLSLFRYGLIPGGALFVGNAETVSESTGLFTVLDRSARIYRREDDAPATLRAGNRTFLPSTGDSRPPVPATRTGRDRKISLDELTRGALLKRFAPPSALVNDRAEILYLHGRSGEYLEPAAGEAGLNILKMAREGLRLALTAALRKAVANHITVRQAGIRVKTNGHSTTVDLTVEPVVNSAAGSPLFLVTFELAHPPAAPPARGGRPSPKTGARRSPAREAERMAALSEELRDKKLYLESVVNELESANEELTASNEELQSINEELQSANEELTTSKEELQSVNEELTTVNAELETRLHELSRANNDLSNLLAATDIGTIFVDLGLRIRRFTPSITKIINLLPADVGRPVGDIVFRLAGYDRLTQDIQQVLETLTPLEAEVQTPSGDWYLMRIRPYRTLDNVIDGGVVTFTDVTELKKAHAVRDEAERLRRLAVGVRDSRDAVIVQGLDGRILTWNPGAERLYGWTEAEAMAMDAADRCPEDEREDALETLRKQSGPDAPGPHRVRRLTKDGRVIVVSVTATAVQDSKGKEYAVATTEKLIGEGT